MQWEKETARGAAGWRGDDACGPLRGVGRAEQQACAERCEAGPPARSRPRAGGKEKGHASWAAERAEHGTEGRGGWVDSLELG